MSIGSERLVANSARFARSEFKYAKSVSKPSPILVDSRHCEAGRSFLQVTSNGSVGAAKENSDGVRTGLGDDVVAKKASHVPVSDTARGSMLSRSIPSGRIATFVPEKESVVRAKRCLIGGVKFGIDSQGILERLRDRGYQVIRVSKLSFEVWTIELDCLATARKMLQEEQEWTKELFSFLRPWQEGDVNVRHKVWLNIYGVPLHAWLCSILSSGWKSFGQRFRN